MSIASSQPDAIVIGSGPNGLAAAITLAQAGHSVVVYEAQPTIGGGTRSAALTLPGFVHDVCSSVHAMAAASPFFAGLQLENFGLRWIEPTFALAHPFDVGEPALIANRLDSPARLAEEASQFGRDQSAVVDLLGPVVRSWDEIAPEILGSIGLPRHPLAMARFGRTAIRPAATIAARFSMKKARAVFAGMAAHSILPLERWGSAAFGMILWTTCYTVGWPFAAGGSQSIADALAALLKKLGGTIVTGHPIESLEEVSAARAVLCDVTPRQLLRLAGDKIGASARGSLEKFRYGPGVFKMDWALDGPIPWSAPACGRAGTVHLGGSFEEIAESERACWEGRISERPFVLLAQASAFDPARAPAGKHTVWAYCHVPNGSSEDMTDRIESQIERFAPGFRARILARSAQGPAALERHNANLIGGDIAGGAMTLDQLFLRPTRRIYGTPIRNVFLCSASTPPGAGAHGMCGYHAARVALRRCF